MSADQRCRLRKDTPETVQRLVATGCKMLEMYTEGRNQVAGIVYRVQDWQAVIIGVEIQRNGNIGRKEHEEQSENQELGETIWMDVESERSNIRGIKELSHC